MIKNIFRLTVIGYVWKRYKILIVSTLVLFVYFWMVGLLHSDFVEFASLNEDKQYLGASFLFKWLALALGLVVYLVVNSRYGRKPAEGINNKPTDSLGGQFKTGKNKQFQVDANSNTNSDGTDPFEQIRKRDRLRSRADFIIEKKPLNK
jgi:hypothetical protein